MHGPLAMCAQVAMLASSLRLPTNCRFPALSGLPQAHAFGASRGCVAGAGATTTLTPMQHNSHDGDGGAATCRMVVSGVSNKVWNASKTARGKRDERSVADHALRRASAGTHVGARSVSGAGRNALVGRAGARGPNHGTGQRALPPQPLPAPAPQRQPTPPERTGDGGLQDPRPHVDYQ